MSSPRAASSMSSSLLTYRHPAPSLCFPRRPSRSAVSGASVSPYVRPYSERLDFLGENPTAVALPARGVLVVVAAKPDNARTPHFRRLIRDRGHQFYQAAPVPTPHGMLDGGQKRLDGRAGCLGLVFSHGGSLADGGRPVTRGE